MATFIIRVQLTVENQDNYTILTNHLIKAGATKRIKATSGHSYMLPNGNYLVESEKDSFSLLGSVARKLKKIGDPKAMILVTEAAKDGIAWMNLPRA